MTAHDLKHADVGHASGVGDDSQALSFRVRVADRVAPLLVDLFTTNGETVQLPEDVARARKRTWLYAVLPHVPEPLDWTPVDSEVIVSGFTHQPKGEHVACEHRRVRPVEASRTPVAFRDVLLNMARSAQKVAA